MKIPSKGELKQTAFNHSSDIDFKDLMSLYWKKIAKAFSSLVIDTILPSDNLSCLRKSLLERI